MVGNTVRMIQASSRPASRSCTCTPVTSTASSHPLVSVTMCRLRPLRRLPASDRTVVDREGVWLAHARCGVREHPASAPGLPEAGPDCGVRCIDFKWNLDAAPATQEGSADQRRAGKPGITDPRRAMLRVLDM